MRKLEVISHLLELFSFFFSPPASLQQLLLLFFSFVQRIKLSSACDPRVAICQAGMTTDQRLMTLKP